MTKRIAARILAIAVLPLLLAVPAAHADEYQPRDNNEATAVNTEDGSSVFRFALSIRKVTDGVVDQTNTATAYASCTDCRTVALAFQVVLVSGSANTVVPENTAQAVNVECTECLTYAKATQIVVGIDGKELTPRGKQRLRALERRMREIERNADQMTDAELLVAAREAEAELIAIFNEELVPIENGKPDDSTTTSSTSTTTSSTSTTRDVTTTSTTEPSVTTTTAGAP